MDNNGTFVDLKKDDSCLGQYVELRNRYCELLLTQPVKIEETRKWLKGDDVEVIGVVQEGILLGAVILYLHRDGEIALFARTPHQGVGSCLLKTIEGVAREKKLKSIWAWVLNENVMARKAFLKQGYILEKKTERYFRQEMKKGIILRKTI